MPDSSEQLRARLRAEIAAIESGGAPRFRDDPPLRHGAPDKRQGDPSLCTAFGESSPGGFDELGADSSSAASESLGSVLDDAPERAFRKIERLCLVREQASEQLRQRLARDGFEPDVAEAALDRALACGLVDDGRFADVLVRSRLSQGRGRRGIASELERLGIDSGSVEALAVVDDDASEVDRALALLDRKPPRSKNRRDGAYRRLAQKGFSASVSSTAARLWCEANPD